MGYSVQGDILWGEDALEGLMTSVRTTFQVKQNSSSPCVVFHSLLCFEHRGGMNSLQERFNLTQLYRWTYARLLM